MPTLDWIGKKAIEKHHLEIPFRLLKSNPDLSIGNVDSGNLIVQGDNLEALNALLPYYAGQVKCICIDPPYNTGKENWTYNDNVNSIEIQEWFNKTVGIEGEDLSRHDKWLCMMYPRLQMLKKFLKEEGVIFINIDDNEISNLISICDDIFGYRNRQAIFTWVRKKKGSNLSKKFRKVTEYIVVYKNSNFNLELYGVPAYAEKQVPLLNRANPVSTLTFKANTTKAGVGVKDGIIKQSIFGNGELSVELLNDIEIQNKLVVTDFKIKGRFRWSQNTVENELQNGSVFTISKTFRINIARYNQGEKYKALSSLLTPDDGIGTNEDATEELRHIFPEKHKLPFDFPKPSSLIKQLILSSCKNDKNAIILDSFAGSGTTGHAVLALNKEDGGNRKFILVELEENICRDITYERIKRIVNGFSYKDNSGNIIFEDACDAGFEYCLLDNPVFDKFGNINKEIKFKDLAYFVFFSETGIPLTSEIRNKENVLIGVFKDTAYYLLYNGILGDKSLEGGNVLTSRILENLPKYNGQKIIFGEGCRLSPTKLKKENIIFKQLPYELKIS